MTAPVAMDICPTDETLAAFIDGRLDPSARETVIAHIADCGDCRDALLLADELRSADVLEEAAVAPVRRFPSQPVFIAAAALSAAAVLIIAFGPMLRDTRERMFRPSPIRQLVDASASLSTRPLDARLSGDYAHQNAFSPSRGPGDTDDLETAHVDAIAAEAEERATKKVTPDNLHALGVAQLFQHKFDKGRETLIRAIKADTGASDVSAAIAKCTDVELLNDLAASLLEDVGDETLNAANHALALQAVNRAWSLDQTPETAWNRALALQPSIDDGIEHSAQENAPAIAAWNEYLKLDSDSKWADEARENIEALTPRAP